MEMEMEPEPAWSRLGFDLTELILSRLPLRWIVISGAVCRQWRSVVGHPSFASSLRRRPWFFLHGRHNLHHRRNQSFAFDPDAGEWALLPHAGDLLAVSGGFRFSTTAPARLSFAPLLRGPWTPASPLSFPRSNPLVAAFSTPAGPRFLVAGGGRIVGGLVDIGDRLAVEIYDPNTDEWETCAPLPPEFRSGNSSQWLSSAVIPDLFVVFGIYSSAIAAFDLRRRSWTAVRSVRPPGILFSFLVAAGEGLVLAGLCTAAGAAPRLAIWAVDHRSLEFSEIGAMPGDLLDRLLVDSDEDEARFASLKCVGFDGLVYVFNEDYHKGYPACVCEVVAGAGGGGASAICRWWKVPPLPGRINPFHKVVAFCSAVPMGAVLAAGNAGVV